jgi:hypothetical protein
MVLKGRLINVNGVSMRVKDAYLWACLPKYNEGRMLDAGCWMLDAGCWMLDAGCWMLDAGCWMLGIRQNIKRVVRFGE